MESIGNNNSPVNPLHVFYICEFISSTDQLEAMLNAYDNVALDFSMSWCAARFSASKEELKNALQVLQLGKKADELAHSENFPQALSLYEQAHKISPADPILLMSIGTLYSRLNEKAKAIAVFNQALTIAPENYPDKGRIRRSLDWVLNGG